MIDIQDVRSALRRDPTTLDLSIDGDIAFTIGDITAADILAVINLIRAENITSLVSVKISSTLMTVAVIPVLRDVLALQPNLAHLALYDNSHLSAVGATAVAEMLNNLPSLTSFDYHHSEAGPRGILEIMYALANKHRDTLQVLNLASNLDFNQVWPTGASQYFLYLTELQDLCLLDCNLREDNMAELGNAIKELPLKNLYIGANHFGSQGAIELFSRIQSVIANLEVLIYDECEQLNHEASALVLNSLRENASFKDRGHRAGRPLFLGARLVVLADAIVNSILIVDTTIERMRTWGPEGIAALFPTPQSKEAFVSRFPTGFKRKFLDLFDSTHIIPDALAELDINGRSPSPPPSSGPAPE